MKILVYGAGIIGSLYAALLSRGGRNVSILARGDRLARIREHGIELIAHPGGDLTRTPVATVEHLEPDDLYDLVLVVLPRHRVSEVLPALAANRRTPSVMFMGNNATGAAGLVEVLGAERALLGFPGAAGVREGDAIRYLICSRREQPTTIGELDGNSSPRIRTIATVLREAGFPVAICPNMDAWLTTHAVELWPTAGALYMVGGDHLRLARTRDGLVLMLRAIREGYGALRCLGIPILPANHRLLEWLPEPLLVALMRRMVAADDTAIKVGHALEARAEWRVVAEEVDRLTDRAGVRTPALDRLHRFLDPAAEPVAEGTARIPLSWTLGRPRALKVG